GTGHLSKLDIIDEFPGVCGSIYLNTAAEGLFMRSHGVALQRYAELKQMGARGRDGCLAVEWRARELAAKLLGVNPQNIAFLASTARGLDVTINLSAGVRAITSCFPTRSSRPPHSRRSTCPELESNAGSCPPTTAGSGSMNSLGGLIAALA